MGMKIDRKLNFVSTITREDGSLVYLHVVPFPYEVVQENCVVGEHVPQLLHVSRDNRRAAWPR